jgi:hypothetical protein
LLTAGFSSTKSQYHLNSVISWGGSTKENICTNKNKIQIARISFFPFPPFLSLLKD